MWAIIWLKIKEIGGSILTSKIFLWFVILGGAFLLIKGYFKKDKYEEQKLPNNGTGIPSGWTKQEAKLIATEGWDLIDGFFDLDEEKVKWAAGCLRLSDDQLTEVYNAYNEFFGKEDDNTLTEAMNGEWVFPVLGGNDEWKRLINRLRGLKLY
jgi:hypothetical protein